MTAKIISLFIAMTFLAFLTAPTAIALFDIDYDIAVLLNTSEEEEEKETKESIKEIEIKSDLNTLLNRLTYSYSKPYNTPYYLKAYTSKALELTSPPPEVI